MCPLGCLADAFCDLIEDGRAAATVGAISGAGGADAACRPVAWKRLVVDDKRGEEGGMDGIQKVEQVAVVASRRVGRDDFRRIDNASRGEFAERDVWLP